jgi:hypothetical protein
MELPSQLPPRHVIRMVGVYLITVISCHKYTLQSNESIADVLSLGPSSNSNLFPPAFNKISGDMICTSYSTRYIAVGSPLVSLYASSERPKSFLAGQTVASSVEEYYLFI